jgi:hypothetical protein
VGVQVAQLCPRHPQGSPVLLLKVEQLAKQFRKQSIPYPMHSTRYSLRVSCQGLASPVLPVMPLTSCLRSKLKLPMHMSQHSAACDTTTCTANSNCCANDKVNSFFSNLDHKAAYRRITETILHFQKLRSWHFAAMHKAKYMRGGTHRLVQRRLSLLMDRT